MEWLENIYISVFIFLILFYQKDGVAMGSLLGPTLACFYMGNLENRILNNNNDCPIKYLRFIDDIFIVSSKRWKSFE